MFRLQVTIIRQTFQYMDMKFQCLQYGIPYSLHLNRRTYQSVKSVLNSHIYIYIYIYIYIQGVPGGMDKTSRECSLC